MKLERNGSSETGEYYDLIEADISIKKLERLYSEYRALDLDDFIVKGFLKWLWSDKKIAYNVLTIKPDEVLLV